MRFTDITGGTKVLIVEGETDKRVVPELMEKNGVAWPATQVPVRIVVAGGFNKLLTDKLLGTYLKQSGTEAVGLVFDADEPSDGRWTRLRAHAQALTPDKLAEAMPAHGCIVESNDGPRLGVWMMPDNQTRGKLENLLQTLVPDQGPDSLWAIAGKACDDAEASGKALYTARDRDKAQVHTWLAWQAPPGLQLHQAIKCQQFAATAPGAQGFVRWFRELFAV